MTAGILSGEAVHRRQLHDCRLHLPRRWSQEIEGRFLTRPVPGSSIPFALVSGAPGGCRGTVRAIVHSEGDLPPTGRLIRTVASWEGRSYPQPAWGERAGILTLGSDWIDANRGGPAGWALEFRGRVEGRILDLWGEDLGPAAEALVLARRDRLDPGLREAFALSGTAHLLAISGFHVGVVVALLVGTLRLAGCRGLRAEGGAVLGCWAYILGIGAPSAAVRAGVILSILLAARLRGQPVVGSGAIGTALLVLLVVQPDRLGSVGFQLSFAATAGLVLLRDPVAIAFRSLMQRLAGWDLPGRRSRHLPSRILRRSADGLIAGVAATIPTLPLLAWHFDRISLVGVPATLLVAPVVAIVIPGIGSSLLASLIPGGLGDFLAGGTGLLLEAITRSVTWISAAPGASVWIARETLVAALVVGTAVSLGLRYWYPQRIRSSVRRLGAALAALTAAVTVPLLPLRGALELHLIDVGQGDALGLRFPSGRWVLVDAGPRSPNFDAGARRVVPYLRRHGASRLEALVLTHPHLDHIGGAPAVLREMAVRGIMDPSVPTGSEDHLEVLEQALDSGINWWPARSGTVFRFGDARISVVHPSSSGPPMGDIEDPNDLSVVLIVEWREAAILLSGDAPATVERQLLDQLPRLTALKVGHHGSRTSTSGELLDRTRPKVAVVPVGDGNRFGHPHGIVLDRLDATAVTVYRTDRDGDVRLIIRPDGSVTARSSR